MLQACVMDNPARNPGVVAIRRTPLLAVLSVRPIYAGAKSVFHGRIA